MGLFNSQQRQPHRGSGTFFPPAIAYPKEPDDGGGGVRAMAAATWEGEIAEIFLHSSVSTIQYEVS